MPTQAEIDAAKAVLEAQEKEQEKVTFDEKQQARVNELIRENMGRAAKELRVELEAQKSAAASLQAELERAKVELTKAKNPSDKKDAKGDVESLQAQITEMKTANEARNSEFERLKKVAEDRAKEVDAARQEALNDRKNAAILNAASEANFYNPDMVARLTATNVAWSPEHNRWVALNAEGQPRMNAAFDPMSLEEFYREYGTQNKFMIRGDVRPGAGSKPNQMFMGGTKYALEDVFGPKSNGALAHNLCKTDYAQYTRLKKEAQAKGII